MVDVIDMFNNSLWSHAKVEKEEKEVHLLTKVFRNKMKKLGLEMSSEAQPDICYPTGFPNLDYLNSFIATQKNPKTGEIEQYINAGLTDGSFVMFVSNTNTGKSTILNQILANLARRFDDCSIFFDDIESGSTESRRFTLTGFTPEEFRERCIIRNFGVNSENIYKRIRTVYDEKMSNPEDYLYDTGYYNMYGEPIVKMKPTLYAVDSIAALMPKDLIDDATDLPGKTYGAQVAANMAVMFQMILQLLKPANIIFLGINHFTTDFNIGPFVKPADVPWLKPGERIPKGKKATLLANQIFRLDQKSKLTEKDPYKINGSIVKFSLVKSRSSGIKEPIPMVYDFANGFDPWLSMLEYLKENNLIYGAGANLSLDPEKHYRFSYGTFKEQINTDNIFRQAFLNTVIPILKTIPTKTNDAKQDMHFDELINDDLFRL